MDAVNFPNELFSISETLLLESEVILQDDTLLAAAMKRVLNEHAPSSNGKEAKDCVIIEHYLAMCAELRRLRVGDAIRFVTSNVNDFGTPGALRAPLDRQFLDPNVDMQLTMDVTAALASL
jgi:hypothetical protein